MTQGTKYNILSCGGIAFANAVDCLAAVREVVYEKQAGHAGRGGRGLRRQLPGPRAAAGQAAGRAQARQRRPASGRRHPAGRAAARRADEGDLPRPARRHASSATATWSAAARSRRGRSRPPRPTAAWPARRWPARWPPRSAASGAGPTAVLNSVCKLERRARAGSAATRSTSASTPA